MGSGKTLTFWIPLLFNEDGITIVITPLIVLGEKNVNELLDVSIAAINLTTTSASDETFKWSGDFRPDYANVGRLRWMVPARVVFYAASATLPCYVLTHVKTLLQMRSDTREIRLTNDRPNIHLTTLEMLDPLNSSHDITRVLRFDGDPPPPLFMVFCNDRKETERICLYARSLAPADSVDKLLWFHSGMSTDFRTKTIEKLRTNRIWGIFCTDAAGMGLDLCDIETVIQWRYTQSLSRDPSKEATGIYMIEPQYTDQRRIRADKKASDHTEKSRQKKPQGIADANSGPSRPTRKRVRSHEEGAGHSTRKKSQCHVGRPEVLTPQTAGKLIVKEERHESYEAAAMDTYINARQRGTCRRRVSDEFFGNRPASPSLACSKTDCPRCIGMPSRLCCDTCNPGSFIFPVPATVAPKQSRAPNKFKIDSCGYLATELDRKLKESLRDWRTRELRDLGVAAGNNMFGSQFIMTDEVLERIVDLAHHEQIDDLATLQSQVNWRNCDRWGPDILIIVKAHAPPIATPSRKTLRPAENLPGPSTGHRPSPAPGSVGARFASNLSPGSHIVEDPLVKTCADSNGSVPVTTSSIESITDSNEYRTRTSTTSYAPGYTHSPILGSSRTATYVTQPRLAFRRLQDCAIGICGSAVPPRVCPTNHKGTRFKHEPCIVSSIDLTALDTRGHPDARLDPTMCPLDVPGSGVFSVNTRICVTCQQRILESRVETTGWSLSKSRVGRRNSVIYY
ncbi:hypothetical protein EDB83DRAFT_2530245 [Lactarius deliciosus]|nr:hypothetical protein EDB83DRAFT_2530245 [Lactarius deliciosus]